MKDKHVEVMGIGILGAVITYLTYLVGGDK